MSPDEIVEGALKHGAVQSPEELLGLLKVIKIDSALEIGTYKGGTLWTWCQLCTGMVVSIDYGDVPRSDFVEWYKPELLWTPKMNSHDPALPGLLRRLSKTYDLLFIDGGHTYEDAEWDYETFSPLAKKYIVLHDIASGNGVKDYWNRLKRGKNYLEFDAKVNLGLGVILL